MIQVQSAPVASETSKIASKVPLLLESVDQHKSQKKPLSAAGSSTRQHTQFAVLSRWSQLADISKALANSEQSERTLRQLYGQLQKLEQQVASKQVAESEGQLAMRVQQSCTLMSHIATRTNSGVDRQLQASSSAIPVISRQLPDKIDLVSTRPHAEKIQLMMGRSGKHLTIELAAGHSPQQNISQLQQAFAVHQIDVNTNSQQRLIFSANPKEAWALKEPWIMTGTGVRIAAGNPVSVSLVELPHSLDKLAELSNDNAGLERYRDEIRQLQRRVRASLQKISEQRQLLQQDLRQVQQPQGDAQELQQLSQNLRQKMLSPEQHAAAIIVAQANTTRNLVAFSLKSL